MAELINEANLADFISANYSSTSINSINKSGIYPFNLANDAENSAALGYSWGMIVHFQNVNNWGTFQLATINLDEGLNLSYRRRVNSGWSPWVRLN